MTSPGEIFIRTVSLNCSSSIYFQIILCPLLGAVTYIDEARKNRTFRWESKLLRSAVLDTQFCPTLNFAKLSLHQYSLRFDLLEKHGCTTELASRLTYAYDKVILPPYWGTKVLILWLPLRFSRSTQWWTTGAELGEAECRQPTQIGQDELEATSG